MARGVRVRQLTPAEIERAQEMKREAIAYDKRFCPWKLAKPLDLEQEPRKKKEAQ